MYRGYQVIFPVSSNPSNGFPSHGVAKTPRLLSALAGRRSLQRAAGGAPHGAQRTTAVPTDLVFFGIGLL